MSFKLTKEARAYFDKLDKNSTTGKFENVWDYYYLCLMVGYKKCKFGEDPTEVEFNKEFPKVYNAHKNLIIATLISTEIQRQGINRNDEDKIRKLMQDLLDRDSSTKLNSEGITLMNKYADYGFKTINEDIIQPQEMDEFLKIYYDKYMK